jgi:hypothetical protein
MQQLLADHRGALGIPTISLYKGDRSRLHNDSAVLLHDPIECAPETYLSRLNTARVWRHYAIGLD